MAAADSTAADIASALRPRYTVRVVGDDARCRVDGGVDVALLDRRAPTRSDEALAALRERGVDCRVVIVTADEPDDAEGLPFDAYVVAPVAADDLRALVDRLRRRADCRERVQELYSLAAERAALVAAGEDSPRFEALQERIERLDDELGEAVRTLDAREAFETALGTADRGGHPRLTGAGAPFDF